MVLIDISPLIVSSISENLLLFYRISFECKGSYQNSTPLAAATMLQHSAAMHSFSYASWLQLSAEYGAAANEF